MQRLKILGAALTGLAVLTACQRDSREQPLADFVPRVEMHAHKSGELLVKYRAGADALSADSRLRAKGASVRQMRRPSGAASSEGVERWRHVTLPAGTDVKAAIKTYRENPDVEYIEPNYVVSKSIVPDDPSFKLQWGLHNVAWDGGVSGADIGAAAAWDVQTGSSSTIVAVIDTGVDVAHPDLAGNIWSNGVEIAGNGIDDDSNGYVDDRNGYDFVYRDSLPNDVDGHGTHVAGIIAARGNNAVGGAGVAWQTSIMALKALDDTGSGATSDAIDAIAYAVQNGAKVINASWGNYSESLALRDAISAANSAGVLFVAAAGNDTNDNDAFPHYPSGYDLPNVISVAATTRFDAKAEFSNFGRNTVDVGAPGEGIFSTARNSSYEYRSGTSMAAPHVSGAAALLLAQNPGATAAGLRTLILERAKRLPALFDVTATGRRLDVYASLQCEPTERTLTVRAPREDFSVLEGDVVLVSSYVTSCGSLFPEYQISATFSNGDASLQLFDDGLHGDGAAGDGIFANYWSVQAVSATTVTVTADAPSQTTLTGTVLGVVRPRVRYQHAPAAYVWTDATSGASYALGDEGSVTIPLGFTFSFYGLPYSAVTISANGLLTFGSSPPSAANNYIPDPAAPNDLIAALWDDLDVSSGSVHALAEGVEPNRRMTIAWTNVSRVGSTGTVSFQATLYEGSNDIVVTHQDVTFGDERFDSGAHAVVGVEDPNGLDATASVQHQPLLADGTARRFYVVPSEPDLTYRVTVTTSPLRSTSGKLVMSVVDGDGTNNNYFNILRFGSDGDVILAAAMQGDASGSLIPGPAYLGDASFANLIGQPVVFGNTMSFLLRVSRLGDFQPYPDSFAFYLLNSDDEPYATTDPLGTDALFAIEIDRPQPLPLAFQSDFASVTIETVGAPVASPGGPYHAIVGSPVAFDGGGSLDSEGQPLSYQWDFGDGSTGTGVNPAHSYGVAGIYTVTLVVSDGALLSAPATTTATIGISQPPVANAGPDQTVNQNVQVNLSGTGSTDPDGSIVAYSWRQVAGPSVTLNSSSSASASFTAPLVSSAKVLTFELSVRDNNGDVDKDTVSITVLKNNIPPTANAGADQTVNEGVAIVLDGRSSSDLDGTISQWEWSQISGPPAAELGGSTPGLLNVTTPSVAADSVMTFRLTITDNRGATASDTVTVTVRNIDNPVANAGPDQTVDERANVSLNGSATDPDGGTIVSYSWVQIAGFAVTLNNANTATPNFTAPSVSADHVMRFRLTVTDSSGLTGADTVDVNVRNIIVPPTAVAGLDQTVNANETVYLDAQASSDADGFLTAFAWTQTAGPAVTLNNANTPLANFTAPVVSVDTVFTFQVAVTDDDQATSTDTVNVVVRRPNVLPVSNAGPNQTVNERSTVQLDGSASNDPDGGPLTYLWTQVSGPAVTLSSTTVVNPTFTAPSVTSSTLLRFNLRVTDDEATSTNDTVDITVVNIDGPPIANAGPDQSVAEGSNVQLDGTQSSAPGGTITQYLWTRTAGPAVTLNGATTATPTFTAPAVSVNTALTFQLRVTNDAGLSATDTVTITVLDRDADTDSDGLGDVWELEHFGDLSQNGSGDPDGDGLTNLQEFIDGTDPNAPDAAPTAASVITVIPGDGDNSVAFSRVAGASRYDLHWGTSPTLSIGTGTLVPNVSSPYLHPGRTNGTPYYYLVVASNASGQGPASAVASGTPGTRSWKTAGVAVSTNPYWENAADSPNIVVDGRGNALMVYTTIEGSAWNIWAQRYLKDAGWQARERLASSTRKTAYAEAAMNSRGDAVVIWQTVDAAAGSRYDLWSSRRFAYRSSWSPAELVENYDGDGTHNGTVGGDASVSVGENGLIAVAWSQLEGGTTLGTIRYGAYASLRTDSTAWTARRRLDTSSDGLSSSTPEVSLDGAGGALFVWGRSNPGFISSDNRVYGVSYSAQGWGTATQLASNGANRLTNTRVATDSQGNGAVLYVRAGGTANRPAWDVVAHAFRTATGWGSAAVIDTATADPTSEIGYGPHLAMRQDGRGIAVWRQGTTMYANFLSAAGAWSGVRSLTKITGSPRGIGIDSLGRGHSVWVDGATVYSSIVTNVSRRAWTVKTPAFTETTHSSTIKLAVDPSGNALIIGVDTTPTPDAIRFNRYAVQ